MMQVASAPWLRTLHMHGEGRRQQLPGSPASPRPPPPHLWSVMYVASKPWVRALRMTSARSAMPAAPE
jgi:hypothetical protein